MMAPQIMLLMIMRNMTFGQMNTMNMMKMMKSLPQSKGLISINTAINQITRKQL